MPHDTIVRQRGEMRKLWKNYNYSKGKDEKKILSFVASEKSS